MKANREDAKTLNAYAQWLLATGDVGPLVAPPEEQSEPVEGLTSSREESFLLEGAEYLNEPYAGRRDFERRLSRAVAEERHRPVVIHGLGGLGKSTLAVRFLLRCEAAGEKVWALPFEESLPAEAFRQAVYDELGVQRPVGLPEEAAQREIQHRKRVEDALREAEAEQGGEQNAFKEFHFVKFPHHGLVSSSSQWCRCAFGRFRIGFRVQAGGP